MKRKQRKREPSPTKTGQSLSSKPAAERHPQFKKALLVMLILIALNLFIYWQVRHFEFTGWDDPLYITQNTQVSKGLSWQGVRWAFTTGHAANWHPLTWLSLMLDVEFFGTSPGPIHFNNVLFHIANSLLLFWVLYRMTSGWGRSAFVAGLFAVHPLHVESVAWAAERKDVLSTCLILLTVWAYIAYVRRPVLRQYLLVLLLFALALAAKPMAITLPVLLLILDFWPLGRAALRKGQARMWMRLAREKLPLATLSMAASVMTLIVQRQGGTMGSFDVFPFGSRVANACLSYLVYLIKMLWPSNLSPFYPFQPVPVWAFIGSILVLAAVSFLAIRYSTKYPFIIAGWCWYLISLMPVIGIIQVGDQARADRYTYLPLIGIFFAVAWGAPSLLRQKQSHKMAAAIAAFGVLGILALLSRFQAGYWKNAETLWRRALESTTRNVHANVNYGFALRDKGDILKAITYYREAILIDPNFAEAHNALGAALLGQNQANEARHHFEQALSIKPAYWEAQGNMGAALARLGKPEEAIPYFNQAMTARPDDATLHHNIGRALAEMGKLDEAAHHFSEAIRIKPDFADPHIQLGNIFLKQNLATKAFGHYREAIRIRPDLADPHANLGIGLMSQGFDQEAAKECTEALRLNPALPEAHNCLATILINNMRDKDALPHLSEAIRIKPDYAGALSNMAIALINTGKSREAIPYLQKVLLIQPDNQQIKEILQTVER